MLAHPVVLGCETDRPNAADFGAWRCGLVERIERIRAVPGTAAGRAPFSLQLFDLPVEGKPRLRWAETGRAIAMIEAGSTASGVARSATRRWRTNTSQFGRRGEREVERHGELLRRTSRAASRHATGRRHHSSRNIAIGPGFGARRYCDLGGAADPSGDTTRSGEQERQGRTRRSGDAASPVPTCPATAQAASVRFRLSVQAQWKRAAVVETNLGEARDDWALSRHRAPAGTSPQPRAGTDRPTSLCHLASMHSRASTPDLPQLPKRSSRQLVFELLACPRTAASTVRELLGYCVRSASRCWCACRGRLRRSTTLPAAACGPLLPAAG